MEKNKMIPAFTASGALPPFIGQEAHERLGCSPYQANLSELRAAFGHSPEREELLKGLLEFRAALHAAGIVDGFQLIDGSFTEDCEGLRQRSPKDIDVVTFAQLPVPQTQTQGFMSANIGLFRPVLTKQAFKCDAYFIDTGKRPTLVVEDTMYLFGLFSHQRVTSLWKGMIRVPLVADDAAVQAAMQAAGSW
jgi:hypothetical protein